MKSKIYLFKLTTFFLLSALSNVNAKAVSFADEELISIETTSGGSINLFSNIESADIDGDGDKDIVISEYINSSDEISWLENDGGDFTAFPQHIVSTSTQAFKALRLSDIDQDGDIDIIGVDESADEILWFENGTSGTSWTSHLIFNGINLNKVKDISLADFDADGDLDIVVAADSIPNLYWYQNEGSAASWTENDTGIITGGNLSTVTTADINNDGTIDIIYGLTSGSPYINIVENTLGDGSSWNTSSVLTGSVASIGGIYTQDLSLDGLAEIYYFENNSDLIQLSYDSSTSSWSPLVIGLSTRGQLRFVDFDNDGDKDILSGNSVDFSWYENTDGIGTTWSQRIITAGLTQAIENIHTSDLDKDGDNEIIYAKKDDGFVYALDNLLFHSSSQHDLTTVFNDLHTDAHHIRSGLLNGDQYHDYISANKTAIGMEIFYYVGDGDGSYLTSESVLNVSSTTDSQISALQLGDTDNDGDLDIIFAASGNENIYLIENLMNAGPFVSVQSIDKSILGSNWGSLSTIATASGKTEEIQLSDINADGTLDIVALDKVNDRVIWLNNDGTWSEEVITISNNNPLDLSIADLDKNGSLDVVVSSSSNPTYWYANVIGDGSMWTQSSINASNVDYQIDTIDMDNDGDIDIVASRGSNSNITWYANNGTGSSWATNDTQISTGNTTFELVSHDIDGDGDHDIMTQDSSGDFSLIIQNQSNEWTLNTLQSGLDNPHSFSVLDYDYDGDYDLISKGVNSNELMTIENRGGQYRVDYTYPTAQNREDSQTFDATKFTVNHNGSLLDGDMQISTLHLGFLGGTGCTGSALTSSEINPLISDISVYSDDGSGVFELFSDTLIFNTNGPFTLANGQITLDLPDQDSNLQIPPQSSKDYFVTVKIRSNASAQSCLGFELYMFVSNTINASVFDTFRAQDRDSLIELNAAFTTVATPNEQLIIASTNTTPTTTGISDKVATESLFFSTDISSDFSDPDGDALKYNAGGLPLSMSIDSATGIISGTPTVPELMNSPFTIVVIATDTQGATINSSFELTIIPFVELIFSDGME